MNLAALPEILKDEPSYRAKQANFAIFQQMIESWDQATNLSKDLREKLKAACPLEIPAELKRASDGMGMGEPFINFAQVMAAIRMLNRPDMLGIGARKISISTVGIVEGIAKLSREPLQINLALSLHAPDDARREKLIPINRKYPIAKVLAAVADYIEKTRRRVMIEYLMLKDFNDSPEDAKKLADLLNRGLKRLFFVNLIACSPGGPGEPSSAERIKAFSAVLEKERITVVERFRFGEEIGGACGQLAGSQPINRESRESSRIEKNTET
ncbi:MAG: hypothetical protein NTV79_10695 [Candidatus Aureabacteria bacterium]|nr:hypothetical protein [Candidatus Auribacterota bacterium]